jgi:CTP:molybdopterin cytidylyltransferase MocA
MASMTVRVLVATALTCGLAAPLRAGEKAAFDPAVARRITFEDVQRRRDAGEKPIIVDARSSLSDVTIRGAVHVPADRVEAWAKDIRKDALIVAYCA